MDFQTETEPLTTLKDTKEVPLTLLKRSYDGKITFQIIICQQVKDEKSINLAT